jgi:hypothetical protein
MIRASLAVRLLVRGFCSIRRFGWEGRQGGKWELASAILAVFLWIPRTLCVAETGELEINVVDGELREPTAVRMRLVNQRNRPVTLRDLVSYRDHFVFDGKAVLELPVGDYTFEMQRGIEYRKRSGRFTIRRGAADNKTVDMIRFANMAADGWYAGDLHVVRPTKDMDVLMLAEDLSMAVVSSQRRNAPESAASFGHRRQAFVPVGKRRFYTFPEEFNQQRSGLVTVLNTSLDHPLTWQSREYPWTYFTDTSMRDQDHGHIDITTCPHSELPVWLASRQVDSLGVLHAGITRDAKSEAQFGRVPDEVTYSGPLATGRWSSDVYFNVLNAGFRIAPSAGSGSGISSNPVGYNRVYVHCGDSFDLHTWWQNLRAGRCLVTNGPVLRVSANGKLPGHVFRVTAEDGISVVLDVKLATQERISYLEIIRDGRAIHEVRLDQLAKSGGRLPDVTFRDSGWLLVRAVCDDATSFRTAFSGPFYVELNAKPRISRRSASLFLDWAEAILEQARHRSKSEQMGDRMRYFHAAVRFWQRRVADATAD